MSSASVFDIEEFCTVERRIVDRLRVADLGSGAFQPCGGGEIGDKFRDLLIDSCNASSIN